MTTTNILYPCIFFRGPRCVARFDFEGEQSDELSFSEGDVIRLKEYVGEEWARGEVNGHVGIFPLNFVEVLEDLPPVPMQKSVPNKIALPGKRPKHYIYKLYTFDLMFKHLDPMEFFPTTEFKKVFKNVKKKWDEKSHNSGFKKTEFQDVKLREGQKQYIRT